MFKSRKKEIHWNAGELFIPELSRGEKIIHMIRYCINYGMEIPLEWVNEYNEHMRSESE